jgi:hypothetical protein
MRWAGHVAHMGEMRSAYYIFIGNLKGTDHLEDMDIEGRIIFNGS